MTYLTSGIKWNKHEEKHSYGMNLEKILLKTLALYRKMKKLVKATKQIKTFIQPTTKELIQNRSRPNTTCYNIQSNKIPQSTRLQLENEHTDGKRFQWKIDHSETIKIVKMIFKIESTDKNNTDRMTAADFPATFSQFKEES